MTPSNQTRLRAAKAALIAALFAAVAALGEIASLASKLPGEGPPRSGGSSPWLWPAVPACTIGPPWTPFTLPRPLDAGLPAPAWTPPTLAA